MVGGVRKGAWTEEEDSLLRKCIGKYGEGKWHQVPSRTGLNRCRKSCRLRWLNYLRPDIKRGNFSLDEVDLIIRLHKLLGNRWSLIAGRLPGRTANDVKNYWNTHQSKKSKHELDLCASKPTKVTTTPENKVLRPRPRTFARHAFINDKSIGITPNNNENSIERIPSNRNIIDQAFSSPQLALESISGMELFGGLFQNNVEEAGGSWPSQLSVEEEEMMNRFWSEDVLTFFDEGNNKEGNWDGNNTDKEKTSIWDKDNNDNETAIDMDIWDLLGYTQDM